MIFCVGLAVLLSLFYSRQFILSAKAWKSLPKVEITEKAENHKFSLVVAMRNESENVLQLLDSLFSLNYPKSAFELILVDDFSDDDSVEKARNYILTKGEQKNMKVVSMENSPVKSTSGYKKQALSYGVSMAQYSWIVTSDADCLHDSDYLKILSAFIGEKSLKMIALPVELSPTKSLFEKMQALEFSGLIGLAGSYIQRQKPFLCNGANLAFDKSTFLELNGYQEIDHQESGDDVWLMQKIEQKFPGQMAFGAHSSLIVKTKPCENLAAFINQRKRWTAKNDSYTDRFQLATLSLDYLFYLMAVGSVLLGIVDLQWLGIPLLMLAVKFLMEVYFYKTLQNRLPISNWFLIYVLAFFPQIIYVILIYPLSKFSSFNWKNRRFNA